MSIAPEEERFAKNVGIMSQLILDGTRKLYDAGYKTVDPSTIALATTIISTFDKHHLIRGFIENSHEKCWDKMKERDEVFFVENANSIFKFLPMDKINLFKDLFLTKDKQGNSVIAPAVKKQVWELFDAMIKISIKYIHKHRSPYSYSTPTGVINTYNTEFYEKVDLSRHSQVWNVKLDFLPKC